MRASRPRLFLRKSRGSVPLRRRTMLVRCVQQMNAATSSAPQSTGETPRSSQTSSGKSAAAVIEPSDMMPEYQTTDDAHDDRREHGARHEHEEDAGGGRDALAAALPEEEHGLGVARRSPRCRSRAPTRARGRSPPAPASSRRGRYSTGSAPFARSSSEDAERRAVPEVPIDVRRAEVARSDRAKVDALDQPSREIRRGKRARDVGDEEAESWMHASRFSSLCCPTCDGGGSSAGSP